MIRSTFIFFFIGIKNSNKLNLPEFSSVTNKNKKTFPNWKGFFNEINSPYSFTIFWCLITSLFASTT
ncbi:MAG: hypothetical protein A3K10_02675 [Bacteroidetes bacterium RIFCSPLOWO2_12_FULL_31_6]|nr:MAG: hypothetical protein A3K10_02675 [Bacteroidetes bacterium RIFCSPLOWO2_12_FULL_31_6]